jgi:hemerythrin-like metal-binding protein
MALLTWSDQYSVGVQAFDKQHRGLVDALNDLHASMMRGQASSVTGPLLHKLVTYTVEHFSAEEAMMKSSKYPGLPAHQQKHVELTKQVEEYVGRFERGEITVSVQLLNFLRDWLTTHILKEDKEYGPWLNKQGVR